MPGLRDVLDETYDTLAAEPEAAVVDPGAPLAPPLELESPEAPETESEAPAAEPDGRARDPETGKFLSKDTVKDTKPELARPPPPSRSGQGVTAGAAAPPLPAAPAVTPAFKPPQSWKPGVREKWAALPPEVQAEVARREREIVQALQTKAEAEKGITPWQEVVRPYEAQIRQQGVEPVAYVGDLLKTAHSMNYGTEAQKADILATLTMQFGIPPAALDRALVARMQGRAPGGPQAPQAPQQPQQFRDPRLDALMENMQKQSVQEADDTASGFAESHEFFTDVAGDMADILDVWAKQGKTRVTEQDLERAYKIACNNNDDVVSTLEQRKAAETVRTQMRVTEQSKAAASSLRNQPAAGNPAQPKGSLRQTLESVYDDLDR